VFTSFSPIFVRLSELGPTATAFHRLLLALPVLWLWRVLEGKESSRAQRPRNIRDLALLGLAGFLFAGDLALFHWSIHLTAVANATLLVNTYALLVMVGSALIFGERFTRGFLAGSLIAVGGIGLLVSESLSFSLANVAGDALGLGAALFYAAYLLCVVRLRARFSVNTILIWSGAIGTTVLGVVALATGESLIAASVTGWAVLVALALVSQVAGQGLIAYALAHLRAGLSSVNLLIQPALSATWAWIILSEPLSPVQTLGIAVTLGGVMVARLGSRSTAS
jgi:drug/metabolite transporter (DMT)-like permease